MNKHFRWLVFLSLCFISSAQAEESAVVNASKINVRGQPTLRSEVVTQLERGDQVTILEVIPDEDAKPNEPASWAKIKLPENTPVWLFAAFVKDGEVNVRRLNLRAGPGENYSVLGRVEKGTKVKTIRTVESWMEIEAPESAYAFVGLSLLERKAATPASTVAGATKAPAPAKAVPSQPASQDEPKTPSISTTNTTAAAQPRPQPAGSGTLALPGTRPPTSTTPSPTTPGQTNSTAFARAAVDSPATPEPPRTSGTLSTPRTAGTPRTNAPSAIPQPTPSTTQTPPATAAKAQPAARPVPIPEPEEETQPKELPKRVVRREGLVHPTRSIQAPTPFALVSPTTGRTINYLFGEEIGLNLAEFRDMKVVVTGEEGIDERWPATPVLKVETIDTAP